MTDLKRFKTYLEEQNTPSEEKKTLSYEDFVNQELKVLDLESLDQLSEPEAKEFLKFVAESYQDYLDNNK